MAKDLALDLEELRQFHSIAKRPRILSLNNVEIQNLEKGEDDIQDTNKFLEWADELYLKEMGKLRKTYALRDTFTKPDPTYERVLKLQKEKQILSEYPHSREPLHFALTYLDPSLRAQVLEKGLLQLLGGWRSRELERRFRTVFAQKIELELSRLSSSLDRDDDISIVLEIQELISLLTRVLVHLLKSSSSRSTPCA
ncbi:hypothetical protein LWI28_013829 [Acer negundo]|uniref:Uncharacterized protein n=1 Tax=Acer negundo TaxID=4023 RepID=A0AAD5J5W7_ACENE|nr:hypothetical protein LWI28_013829 [Acer negundo]